MIYTATQLNKSKYSHNEDEAIIGYLFERDVGRNGKM